MSTSRMTGIAPAMALAGALALALFAPSAVRAQEPEEAPPPAESPALGKLQEAMQKAAEKHQAGDYAAALAAFAEAEKLVETAGLPDDAKKEFAQLIHYNSACALSLSGKKEEALARLDKAMDAGFLDFDHMASDGDLDPIRKDPRFPELMAKYKAKADELKAKELAKERDEVLARISKDALFPFDFSLTSVDGAKVELAQFRGKVLLVDVWGTWCPPCRKEIPHLVELHGKLAPKGFAIVGLNAENDTPPGTALKTVKAFIAEQKIPYPCALIDEAFTEKIPDFEGFPTLLLIDRAGRVRLKLVGYTEREVLEAAAEKLLAEPAPAAGEAPKGEPAKGK